MTKPHFSVHDKIHAERLGGADSFKGLRHREGIVQMGWSAGWGEGSGAALQADNKRGLRLEPRPVDPDLKEAKRAPASPPQEDDEGRQEEFRQLLKSYMRFYSFVSQVVSLGDTGQEKLYSYAAWLIRLVPNREVPADIEITDDMMRLHAF